MKKIILLAACIIALSGIVMTSNGATKSADTVPPILGSTTYL